MNLAKAKNVEQDLSMEEILASIRRIIAEDQAVGHSAPVPVRAEPMPDSNQNEILYNSDKAGKISGEKEQTYSNQQEPIPQINEKNPINGRPLPPSLAIQPNTLKNDVDIELEQSLITQQPSVPTEESNAEEEKTSESLKEQSIHVASSSNERGLDQAAYHLSTLLSKQTDEAIATSFSKLSKVSVAPTHQTSVDDFLKQMLRPMLKDWLDANLPRVVEQIVQAEIERALRSGNIRIG